MKARERKGYEVLVCTDIKMQGEKVLRYYRLRFQIEFLIRDAKTHSGLDHCQGRSEQKLYNHFNMAMIERISSEISDVGKAAKQRTGAIFDARHQNILYEPVHDTDNFCNLALDMSCSKIKRLYDQCLNIGSMAA